MDSSRINQALLKCLLQTQLGEIKILEVQVDTKAQSTEHKAHPLAGNDKLKNGMGYFINST